MVIHENSKKGNIIRYNGNNSNNNMYGGGPAPNQQIILSFPGDIAINNSGYLFVTDGNNHCIRIFSPFPHYTLIHTIGTPGVSGNADNLFFYPLALAIHRFRDEDILYVADTDNHRIQVYRIRINANNTITVTHLPGQLGSPNSIGTGIVGNTADHFFHPWKIVINNNILYVADEGNHRIQVFRIMINADNTITSTHLPSANGGPHSIGTGLQDSANNAFNTPRGITIHRHRDEDILYVADTFNHRIQIFRIMINANNTITATHLHGANGGPHSIGTGLHNSANNAFSNPRAITIHRHRDEYKLYIADTFNHRIQIFNGDITNPATLQYYDTIPSPPPRYTILTQNRVIPLDIRNTRCKLCNFNVCTPIQYNPNNNANGYVVRLDTPPIKYLHYTCIYNYITTNSTVDISEFVISTIDTKRLINDNLDNNNVEGTNFFIPDFIILKRETDIPVNSRETLCTVCRFPLCTRVIDTNNNLNGYVVHLHNLTNPNTYYYHYKCISKYFTNIRLSDNPYQSPDCATIMDRDDIYKLLNIVGKEDAVNGNGFY